MKKLVAFVLCLFSISCFAAAQSFSSCTKVSPWPSTESNFDENVFCNQFEEAAYCHCAQSGLPYDYCKSKIKMAGILKRMMEKFHNIPEACKKGQDDISVQDCIDEWNYYSKAACRKIP